MLRTPFMYVLAAAAIAQIQPASPTPTGKGSIEGSVSDAAGHSPLRKVQVTLTGALALPLMAVTDAGGRFRFSGLAAGSYWVNASKSGYNPPQAIFGAEPSTSVTLGNDEHKQDVDMSLMPGGAIGGRLVNEAGAPVRGCSVAAVQPAKEQNRHGLTCVAGGMSTDDKGAYHIQNLAPGRYFVFAQCQAELPAAHPLLARGDPRIPHETYLPQFYGGGLDPATATKLTLAAGAMLEGVDFQMARIPAFTLRGTLTATVPEALAGGVNILLLPQNRLMRNLTMMGAAFDSHNHTFEIQAVVPGSYLLLASAMHDGSTLIAQRTVDVGPAAPEPVALRLTGGAELKGNIEFDCDDHPPVENGQISLEPLEEIPFPAQPRTQMDKDGAFTLAGIVPGRWRLAVGVPAYVKSVSLGGQPVSPYGFTIGAGAMGPLRIGMGCKLAQVSISVAGIAAGRQVSALIYPEDPDRLGAGLERAGATLGAAQIEFVGLPPGRYRMFATDVQNPWPLVQRADVLKALESLTASIDLPEGGHVNLTVEVLPREDLMRAVGGL